MSAELSSWDMHEVKEKMHRKSIFEIITLYKEQEKLVEAKCLEYMRANKDKAEATKERLDKEIEHLMNEKCVIAVRIADEMSKASK